MRLSDEQIEHYATSPNQDHRAIMARELLSARKVVEAAREYRKTEADLLKGTAGLMNTNLSGERLDAALASHGGEGGKA